MPELAKGVSFNPFEFNHPGGQVSDIEKMMDEIQEQRYINLQKFYLAFLSETGLRPSEVEMVEEREHNGTVRWRFQQIDRSSSIFNDSVTLRSIQKRIEFEKNLELPLIPPEKID